MDDIWVEIETNKGTPNVNSYRGKLSKKNFEAILAQKGGWVCLQESYWIAEYHDPQQNRMMAQGTLLGRDGIFAHFHGDTYLRIEHIVSVSPLDGEQDRKQFLGNKIAME